MRLMNKQKYDHNVTNITLTGVLTNFNLVVDMLYMCQSDHNSYTVALLLYTSQHTPMLSQ